MKPAAVSEDTVVQEITIRGSAERIFTALTDPRQLATWWGVEGRFQARQAECDVRPGGKWRMSVEAPIGSGRFTVVSGEYVTIDRPHLLVYTWLRENFPESVVRWDLEESGGETRVRLTHSGLTPEAARVHTGWPMILSMLKAYVEPAK